MVSRWVPKAKAVPHESREDMKVRVKDLLAGRHPVGQEEIDPFTTNTAKTNRLGQALRHANIRSPTFMTSSDK